MRIHIIQTVVNEGIQIILNILSLDIPFDLTDLMSSAVTQESPGWVT